MHSLKEELKSVLNSQKETKEMLSLEQFVNSDFETIYNKKMKDVNVAYDTLVAMYKSHIQANPYSMEAHNYIVSMEGFFSNFFEKLVDVLVSVFGFIFDLVVRIFNSILSMFKTKKPKESELIIDNHTKMIAYTYINNITNNSVLLDNKKNLESVRTGLENCVRAQGELINGLYGLVTSFANNNLDYEQNFNIKDLVDKIFETAPIIIDLDESVFNNSILKVLDTVDSGDAIFSNTYSLLPNSRIVKFKLLKDKIELEEHNYNNSKVDINMDTTIRHLTEDDLTTLFDKITDNDVKETITKIEQFIKDCKTNKTNFLGSVSGYNRKVESVVRDVNRLLNGNRGLDIRNRDSYINEGLNDARDFIKLANQVNKFSINYLKDVLVSTMSTYSIVPQIYTIPETE